MLTKGGWPSSQKGTSPWGSKWTITGVSDIENGLQMRPKPDSLAISVRSVFLIKTLGANMPDQWSHAANPMTKSKYGVWECYVPPSSSGQCAIPHDSMVKISMTLPSGDTIDRIPAWIERVTQDLSISPIYDGRFWNPTKSETYTFKHGHSTREVDGLKIYEAHGQQTRRVMSLTLQWVFLVPTCG